MKMPELWLAHANEVTETTLLASLEHGASTSIPEAASEFGILPSTTSHVP